MKGFGKVPDELLEAADLASDEGRLHWRVTNAQGRPCNGGEAYPLAIGEWSGECEPVMCKSGWHLTDEPHKWRGSRVWLCEGRGGGQRAGSKTVWAQIRPLAEVDPYTCLDASARIRAGGKNAPWANLYGAKLVEADLRAANLRGADLTGANLYGSQLYGANLTGAKLRGANLFKANLRETNLRGANLVEADLTGANLHRSQLYGANLYAAKLRGADLTWAKLTGAKLTGANLSRADLTGANLQEAKGVYLTTAFETAGEKNGD